MSDIETTLTMTGADLREQTWRQINLGHLDMRPRYITSEFNGAAEGDAPEPINGLIRHPMGYYRLAEDTRDGTRILLHSYERDQLTGMKWPDGAIMLDPENCRDVYGITARSKVRGAIFRDDMHHDIRFLEHAVQQDMNLHCQDLTPEPDEGNEKPLKVIKLANRQVAFGLFECEDGKWKVRMYDNLSRDWDESGQFVHIDEKAPEGFSGQVFSTGTDVANFEDFDSAFEHVRRAWNTEAIRNFRGKPRAAESANGVKAGVVKQWKSFWGEKKYRDWGVAVPVGIGAGFLSSWFSGLPLVGALLAVGSTSAWVFGAKAVENAIQKRVQRANKERDQSELEQLKPYFEQNQIKNYLRQDPATERRFRKKLDLEVLPHLKLLNHKEADINYDDGVWTPAKNPLKDFEHLVTAPYRYFGSMFDGTHHDKGVLTCVFPNGLLSVVHVDPETRDTRHYLLFNDDFNVLKGDKKHLDPKLYNLPGEGPMHKITHVQGKDFRYTSLSREEFMAALMAVAGPEAKDFTAFGMKLSDLFNVQNADQIKPKAKHGDPILPAENPTSGTRLGIVM